jgi:hypothetical protein
MMGCSTIHILDRFEVEDFCSIPIQSSIEWDFKTNSDYVNFRKMMFEWWFSKMTDKNGLKNWAYFTIQKFFNK